MSLAGRGIVDDQTRQLGLAEGYSETAVSAPARHTKLGRQWVEERSSPVGPTSDGSAPTALVRKPFCVTPKRT